MQRRLGRRDKDTDLQYRGHLSLFANEKATILLVNWLLCPRCLCEIVQAAAKWDGVCSLGIDLAPRTS